MELHEEASFGKVAFQVGLYINETVRGENADGHVNRIARHCSREKGLV